MEDFVALLEASLPRFFRGALALFNSGKYFFLIIDISIRGHAGVRTLKGFPLLNVCVAVVLIPVVCPIISCFSISY